MDIEAICGYYSLPCFKSLNTDYYCSQIGVLYYLTTPDDSVFIIKI